MRSSTALIIVLAVCWPLQGEAQREGGGAQGIALQAPQRPFTETMAAMVARDAQWRAEIEAGLRPRPPRVIAAGNHVRGQLPKSDGDGPFAFFLPAVFLDPDPELREMQDWRLLAPQNIGASFIGINMQDQFSMGSGWIPPDTGGAIGPSHFLEVINGSVAAYTRTGTRLSHVSLNSFLTVSSGGVTYPRSYAFDPRCVYDRRSGRWFITALEYNGGNNNHAILAVSRTSDPTGTWDKYVIQVGRSGWFTDYPTLGIDDNGVYIPVTLFGATSSVKTISATRKASLIGSPPSLGTVYLSPDTQEYYATPVAAVSLDATPSTGKAWFVGSNPSFYRDMRIGYLTWPTTGAPTFSAVSNLTLPAFAAPPTAPQKGSTTDIDAGDMRMHSAFLRGGRLWTCRTVGVNSVGGATGADRTAAEWVELDVSGASATIVQNGRLYDGAPSSPVFFYYPSVAVNGLGQMALSFSDSNGNRYVGAETAGRLATDTPGTLQSIMSIKSGANTYVRVSGGFNRWGDYSTTSVDPNDDLSIWTIQEYATASKDIWGTWVAQLLAPAPTLNNPNGSAAAGTTGVVLNLTGTGFFDPGAGFPNRLAVQLTGGAVNGISNYAVTYNSPTSVTVTFDIAGNATVGSRNIVLTNPDGQQATVTDGFNVTAGGGATTLTVNAASGSIGQTVNLQATLVRSSDSTPLSGQTIAFTVDGVSAGSGTTNGSGVATVAYTIPEAGGIGSFTIGATFAGNPPYNASSGANTLTVSKAATTTSASNAAGAVGQNVNLAATLTRNTDSAPLGSRTLAFQVAGTAVGNAPTNASGVATLAYVIPEALGIGTKTVRADFGGDATHLASFGTADLTVSKAATTTTASNASGAVGQSVNLAATLTRNTDSAPLASRTLAFQVAGTGVGNAPTNASGVATLAYVIPEALGIGTKTLRADFGGDATHLSSFGTADLTVSKAATTTVLQDAAGKIGASVTLTASLTRNTDSAALTGRSISFQVAGSGVGSATTNGAGVAALPFVIPSSLGVGTSATRADFGGDAAHLPSLGTASLTVSKGDTVLVAEDANGQLGGVAPLTATLSCVGEGLSPVADGSVRFLVAGSLVGSDMTDASGVATMPYTIPVAGGPRTDVITAEFDGSALYNGSTDTADLIVAKADTALAVQNTSGRFGDAVDLQATLTRATDGAPLASRTVAFSIEGTGVGDGVTDASGAASVTYVIPEAPGAGAKAIGASWTGDADHNAAAGSGTLDVIPWPTAITADDAAGTVSLSTTLSATLIRTDTSAPLDGRLITFTAEGTPAGSAVTNASGVATTSYVIADTIGSGALQLEASFAGDTHHAAASDTATLTVTRANTTHYTINRTGTITELAILRQFDLKRTTDNAMLAGKTITFRIDGTAVGTGTTNAGGDSTLNWIVTDGPATRTITTEFAGDGAYNGSSANATLTAQTHATKMFGTNRDGRITSYRIFKAWLYRLDNTPVVGKPITFKLDGTVVGTDVTRTTGLAQVGYTIADGAGAGTRTIRAEWAGDGGYLPSSCTNTLTVYQALPYIWVMPRSVASGGVARLYAYFRRLADYQKQEGKTVTFRIDGTWIANVVTGTGADAGIARYNYTTVQPPGPHTIRCEFAGDAWVEAGYGEATLTIL